MSNQKHWISARHSGKTIINMCNMLEYLGLKVAKRIARKKKKSLKKKNGLKMITT